MYTALEYVEQYNVEIKDKDQSNKKNTTKNEISEEEKSDLESLDKNVAPENVLSKVAILILTLIWFDVFICMATVFILFLF